MPEQQDVKWCILNAHLNFPTHVDSVTVNFLETVSSFIMLVRIAKSLPQTFAAVGKKSGVQVRLHGRHYSYKKASIF